MCVSMYTYSMWLRWSKALQNYNNIVQSSWREGKRWFIHPSGRKMRERKEGKKWAGAHKVQVYIICYLQLAHLLFAQVCEYMEGEYFKTKVHWHNEF